MCYDPRPTVYKVRLHTHLQIEYKYIFKGIVSKLEEKCKRAAREGERESIAPIYYFVSFGNVGGEILNGIHLM